MTSVAARWNQALESHRAGRIAEAEEVCRDVVRDDPHHAEAWHLLGVAAQLQRRPQHAIEYLGRAITERGDAAEYHYHLAGAYRATGDVAAAVDCYRRAIAHSPRFAAAHFQLGNLERARHDLAAAALAYEQAIAIDDQQADAWNQLGLTRRDLGELDQACTAFRRAIEARPRFGAAHANLGSILARRREWEAATKHLEQAREEYPQHVELARESRQVYVSWSQSLRESGEPAAARTIAQRAVEQDPCDLAAWSELGRSAYQLHDVDAARHCWERVREIDPFCADAEYGLARLAHDAGDWGVAETLYRAAIRLAPDLPEAHLNLGVVLQEQLQLLGAKGAFDKALMLRPLDGSIRFHRGLLRLLEGDYLGGWGDYAARVDRDPRLKRSAEPRWTGESLAGKTVLLWGEQGVGEEIQFASCVPDVIAHGARVRLECDPRLVALFARSFPEAEVFPRSTHELSGGIIGADVYASLADLPRVVRRQLTDFPSTHHYLTADPRAVTRWREWLATLSGTRKIGIAWRGGSDPNARRKRSIELDAWRDLLAGSDATFVSVQHDATAEELSEMTAAIGKPVVAPPYLEARQDLDDWGALMRALDLVITIDNTTVHVAGALGVPTWLLLPQVPNWRWLLNRDDSPWYPSVRLFRQTEPGDWDSVLADVAVALAQFLRTGELPSIGFTFPTASPCELAKRAPLPIPSIEIVPRNDFATRTEIAPRESSADHERAKYERMWQEPGYRNYSPGGHDVDRVSLVSRLRTYGAVTVLDAGCGSGELMQRLMTEHADEFEVRGFDIAANCLNPWFDDVRDQILTVGCLWDSKGLGSVHDAVICNDVLEHVPTEQVTAVLKNFRAASRRLCYLSIALFNDLFGPAVLGEPLHLTVKPSSWWLRMFDDAGFQVDSWAVEQGETGADLRLHAFLAPRRGASAQTAR